MNDTTALAYALIEKLRIGKISVAVFCEEFEASYNFGLINQQLSAAEAMAFRDLFEKVVWYSPFPAERETIPGYLGEEEVMKAVEVASRRLGMKNVVTGS